MTENKDIKNKEQVNLEHSCDDQKVNIETTNTQSQPQEDTKNNKEKKKKTAIIAALSTIFAVALILVLTVVFVFNYTFPRYLLTYKSIADLKIEYKFDESCTNISNIPYDNYLSEVSYKEKDATLISNLPEITDNAVENGRVLNKLVENIYEEGGGTIVFDISLMTTPIKLHSNISIIILKDITIELIDYSQFIQGIDLMTDDANAIFYATDSKNISIMGPGTIKINGTTYTEESMVSEPLKALENFNMASRIEEVNKRVRKAKACVQPGAVSLSECQKVEIKQIHIIDCAQSAIFVNKSKDVSIKNVVIENNVKIENSTGVSVLNSQSISFDHCFIVAGGDGIAVGATSLDTKSIKVNRCTIISLKNGFIVGGASSKNITNLDVMNTYFVLPEIIGGLAGIVFASADGSNISDIYVDNIEMKGIAAPVLLWLGNRLNVENGSTGRVGSIKNASISNITCKDVEMPTVLVGCKVAGTTYAIKDVRLANFDVTYRQNKEVLSIGPYNLESGMSMAPSIENVLCREVDNNIEYLDFPVYGVFARHVRGLKIINYNVTARYSTGQKKDNITNETDRYDTEKVFVR